MTKNANIPNKHSATVPEVKPRPIIKERAVAANKEETDHQPKHGLKEDEVHKHHHRHHHKVEQQSDAPPTHDDTILLHIKSPTKDEVNPSDIKLDIPIPIVTPPILVEEEIIHKDILTH